MTVPPDAYDYNQGGGTEPTRSIDPGRLWTGGVATALVAALVAVVGVLIASYVVGDADGRGDVFLADKAWFYVTLLTIGYMVSRGLAKAGSRAHRDA